MKRTIYLICCLGTLALNSFADGLDTWTKVATTSYGAYSAIVYGNGMYAANSAGNNSSDSHNVGLSVSSDGLNWQHFPTPDDYPTGLAFGNGVFVKTGQSLNSSGDAGYIHSSSNAIGLTNDGRGDFEGQYGIAFGNGIFVAIGHLYENDVGTFRTSHNGTNWTTQNAFPDADDVFLTGIAYSEPAGEFLAVGFQYLTSSPTPARALVGTPDGTFWFQVPTNYTASLGGLTGLSVVRDKLYAVATRPFPTVDYYTTFDGFEWTTIQPPFPSIWVPFSSTNGIYLSINSSNSLYSSADGTNWVLRNTGITNHFTCLVFDGTHFLGGTADGSIFRSGGIVPSLSGQSLAANGGFQITLNGGFPGKAYQLQASTDLSAWNNLFTFTNVEVLNQYLDAAATNYSRRYYRTVLK